MVGWFEMRVQKSAANLRLPRSALAKLGTRCLLTVRNWNLIERQSASCQLKFAKFQLRRGCTFKKYTRAPQCVRN